MLEVINKAGLSIALLALLIAAGVILFVDFDSPELGAFVLAEASNVMGVEVQAEGFSLNLFHGLALETATAKGEFPGGEYDLALGRLVFEHRWLPLLSGTLVVDRLLLDSLSGDIELDSGRGGGRSDGAADAPDGAELGLRFEVGEIAVRDSNLVIRQVRGNGQPESSVIVSDLNLSLRNLVYDRQLARLGHAVSGDGKISVSEVVLGSLSLRQVEGQVRIENAKLDMMHLDLMTDYGPLEAQMRIDLDPAPFTYVLATHGGPIDVNALVGAADGFGLASLELDGSGAGTGSADLAGQGTLQMDSGRLPAHEVLDAVERIIGIGAASGGTLLSGSRYQATEARFQIERNKVILDPFSLEAEQAGLQMSGWIDLEGPMELQLLAKTPREGIRIQGVPDSVLDLLTDEEGLVEIPLRVTGTREAPRVLPDLSALLSQSGTRKAVTKAIEDIAGEVLEELFKKKK